MSSCELSFDNVMVVFLITLVVLLLKRRFCFPSLPKDPSWIVTRDATGKYYQALENSEHYHRSGRSLCASQLLAI